MTANKQTISAHPHSAWQYSNPLAMARNLWQYRELIWQFTNRKVSQRYQGTFLGVLWSFITPLAMLLVYTFAFSVILQARWNDTGHGGYALFLFSGFIPFTVFTEALTSARLIISNVNFVKKVVFPLEILSTSLVLTSVIHSLFSLTILIIGIVLLLGQIPWTIIYLPFVYLPLILLCLGTSWFVASVGVFIRDLGNLLGVLTRMLFFLTPIIYPITIIPEPFRSLIIFLNPMTFIIEQFRAILLINQPPNWIGLLALTTVNLTICVLGYTWFMKSKAAFADVI